MIDFSSLSLSPAMLKNLQKLGYTALTPIQEKTIPLILEGKDVLAQAKTGSGKTAAFGIGLLQNLDTKRYRIQALVLCPTRELSEQVSGELRRLARFVHNIKVLNVTGGVPMYQQELSLKHEAHIVVGTPGRIQKLLERQTLVLNEIRILVLDEADRMLDMGFLDQISHIIKQAPVKRQTLCFSATFPKAIKRLSRSIMIDKVEVAVETRHEANAIEQHFFTTSQEHKTATLLSLLAQHRPDSTLIFCNTKDACRQLDAQLRSEGVYGLCLHGDLEQKERTEVLVRFANGSSRVLVATDVAARGLDIDDLGAVINYDMPLKTETYVHRIGRTGRAGRQGLAFSLLLQDESVLLKEIGGYLDTTFALETVVTADNKPDLQPDMITLSINGGRRNKISAGDLLGALTTADGIEGKAVGKIDRLDHFTFVAVRRHCAKRALKVLQSGKIKGRRYIARIYS